MVYMKFLYYLDTILTTSDLETLADDLLSEIPISRVEVTTLDSGIIQKTPCFRTMRKARTRTTTTDPVVRLVFVLVSLLLQNL